AASVRTGSAAEAGAIMAAVTRITPAPVFQNLIILSFPAVRVLHRCRPGPRGRPVRYGFGSILGGGPGNFRDFPHVPSDSVLEPRSVSGKFDFIALQH